jgi:hypothetical protein
MIDVGPLNDKESFFDIYTWFFYWVHYPVYPMH